MTAGILELAIIIGIAAVLSMIAHILRQPIIIAYLATGALIGIITRFGFFSPLGLESQATFQIFSDLGIMFLLFLVGLEVNYTSIRLVGKVSLMVGLMQLAFTFGVGYLLATVLGFATISSLYIAIALTFSSTIIIVKLLSEKKQLNSLYGRISIGMMLVQDFVAILILIALSGLAESTGTTFAVVKTLLIGIALFAAMGWLGQRVFPYLFDKVARSQELLFLMSIAWVFGVVTVVSSLGFSIEIGGFLAGLALANASEHYQIASRVKNLRDFFILIFFAILGSSLLFTNLSGMIVPVIVLSLFVLIGNPIIVLIVMGALGYRKRTSFLTGLTVAQISEFSLVLAALGLKLGHVGNEVVSVITAVGVVTITISTYVIYHADRIFDKLENVLKFFERKNKNIEDGFPQIESRPIILIGFRRTGQSIAMHLSKGDFTVIDYDPEVVASLRENNFAVLFGDAADDGIFERMDLSETHLIVSTSPARDDTLALLESVKYENLERLKSGQRKLKAIVRAEEEDDAAFFYERGAEYVLLPHFTSGHYLGTLIAGDHKIEALAQIRKREREMMRKADTLNAANICSGPLHTQGEARTFQSMTEIPEDNNPIV